MFDRSDIATGDRQSSAVFLQRRPDAKRQRPASLPVRLAIAWVVAVLGIATAASCSGGSKAKSSSALPQANETGPPQMPLGPTVAGIRFVPATQVVRDECKQTADAIGYAVPCPTALPRGIMATPGAHGCRSAIIEANGQPGCGGAEWRDWMDGSSQLSGPNAGPAGFEHLVMQAAPRVIPDPARAIDGPATFPGSRVQPRGTVRINRSLMHLYYVPPDLNEGSAFAHHLVLVWIGSGHTYAYGFHVVTTLADARALDFELVRHLVMVPPQGTDQRQLR